VTPTEVAAAGDVNLTAAWVTMARHAGHPASHFDSLTMVATGLPVAFFNGVFLDEPTSDPEGAIAATIEHFGGLGVPFLIWIREGLDEPLLNAGRAAGLRDAGNVPSMGLRAVEQIPDRSSVLDVIIADDEAGIEAHRTVVTAGFELPPEMAGEIIGNGLLDDPDIAVAIGCLEGIPVATALLCRSGTTAGVYNVATAPDYRRQGYGETVTWAVVAEGVRRGCTHSVLQSSPSGYPVYRRMGYQDVAKYLRLEGPPNS
jgi:ribosomal protein S18 acetylase RimI-like enzyme